MSIKGDRDENRRLCATCETPLSPEQDVCRKCGNNPVAVYKHLSAYMIAVAVLVGIVNPLPATAVFFGGILTLTLSETEIVSPERRDMGEIPTDDKKLEPKPPEYRVRGVDLTEDLTPDKTKTNGNGRDNERENET